MLEYIFTINPQNLILYENKYKINDYFSPTIEENLKPFMAIIYNTENYN
jgi:hypothetical protein